MKDIKTI